MHRGHQVFECVLKLLNLVVMAVKLAMVGYGAYLLVMWLQFALPSPTPVPVAIVTPQVFATS
jgi:hypothetical protein